MRALLGRRAWLLALVLGACVKKPVVPTGPRLEDDELLKVVRERPVDDILQARFSIKVRSPKLGIVAPRLAGALVISRPDNAWIAVYDPVGSPVVQLASDGERVIFLNSRDREAVVQTAAGDVLGEVTGGRFAMADIVDILLGMLPVDRLDAVGKEDTPEGVRYTFEGPGGLGIAAWVDPSVGTPLRLEVAGKDGLVSVSASYVSFITTEEGRLMPAGIAVEVPSVELTLDLAFKSWKPLPEPPDLFAPPVPEGYTTMTFAAFGERARKQAAEKEARGDGTPPRPE